MSILFLEWLGVMISLKGKIYSSAIRHLAQTEKKFLIVFVGRDHKKIESKISEICFEHSEKVSIQVLDHVENINEILSVFDVFCLPSISEGFPNALVEAMLMGKPCIASLVGDVEDIIADHSNRMCLSWCLHRKCIIL